MVLDSGRSRTYHSRYCALRNAGEAVGFVLVSATIAFLCWRDLGKALARPQGRFVVLTGHLIALGLLAQLFVFLRCFRERVLLGLGMGWLALGFVEDLLPRLLEPVAPALRTLSLLIWVLAVGVSLSVFVSALRNGATGDDGDSSTDSM
jgi:hypothetical protein